MHREIGYIAQAPARVLEIHILRSHPHMRTQSLRHTTGSYIAGETGVSRIPDLLLREAGEYIPPAARPVPVPCRCQRRIRPDCQPIYISGRTVIRSDQRMPIRAEADGTASNDIFAPRTSIS